MQVITLGWIIHPIKDSKHMFVCPSRCPTSCTTHARCVKGVSLVASPPSFGQDDHFVLVSHFLRSVGRTSGNTEHQAE